MNWKDHIHSNPDVLIGKPVIKGTRIAVEFILDLLSQGWTEGQILESYPSLSRESLNAIFSFALDCMNDKLVLPVRDRIDA